MPTYYCTPCKVKFFAHDTRGRICQGCHKGMHMQGEGEPAGSHAYKIGKDNKKPFLAFGPKYGGQIVIALIDGKRPTYKGGVVNQDTYPAFNRDKETREEDKKEFLKQEGERQSAENLHDKEREKLPKLKKHLCLVQDYTPNTQEQLEQIRSAFAGLPDVGGDIRMYVVAHHDPDSKRMAGLEAVTLARLIAAYPKAKSIKRLILVGCHTAGEAASAQEAEGALMSDSFAAQLHQALGTTHAVYTEVAAFTSFVRIRAFGQKEERFDEKAAHAQKLAKSKVLFVWNENKLQARDFAH